MGNERTGRGPSTTLFRAGRGPLVSGEGGDLTPPPPRFASDTTEWAKRVRFSIAPEPDGRHSSPGSSPGVVRRSLRQHVVLPLLCRYFWGGFIRLAQLVEALTVCHHAARAWDLGGK